MPDKHDFSCLTRFPLEGPEKLSKSPKVTQQVSGRARIQARQVRYPSQGSGKEAWERKGVVRRHSYSRWAVA